MDPKTDRRSNSTGVNYMLLRRAYWGLTVFLMVFILLAVSYYKLRNPDIKLEAPVDPVYFALQMMFGNTDSKFTDHNWWLMVLRSIVPFVLPLFGIIAVVKALRVRLVLAKRKVIYKFSEMGQLALANCPWFNKWSNYFSPRLVVVIGLGRRGFETARVELKGSSTSVVVLERNPENPRISQVESEGAIVWVGDGSSIEDLRIVCGTKPRRVWIATGESRWNLLILDMLRKEFVKQTEGGRTAKSFSE